MAGKRIKIVLNFENEKNRFAKFENFLFLGVLEFFENLFFKAFRNFKSARLGVSKLKNRFEINFSK